MDSIFRQLEKAGKADVENLLQWMKDSKVIGTMRDEETRKLLKGAVKEQQVELEKFKAVLAEIAIQQSKTVEQLSRQLAAKTPKVIDAAIVGLEAFKEALKK